MTTPKKTVIMNSSKDKFKHIGKFTMKFTMSTKLLNNLPILKQFLENPTQEIYNQFATSKELISILALRIDELHDFIDELGIEYVINRETTKPFESEVVERLIDDVMILHCEMLQEPIVKVIELYKSFKVKLADVEYII